MLRRVRRQMEGVALLLLLPLAAGCSATVWRAHFIQPSEYHRVDPAVPFLKCHTQQGEVFVLDDWEVEEQERRIAGTGVRYDRDRKEVARGAFSVPFEDVRLLETNEPRSVTKNHMVVLGVMAGVSLAVTAACLANPKACFGSCPTFFALDEAGELALQAEGFSASVARSLEATDVDALYTARPEGISFELLMTNDALETHAVRSVRVLAAPRPEGGRVFRAGESFYPARLVLPPVGCRSGQGDCLAAVGSVDAQEYLSPADPEYLAAPETVELDFPYLEGSAGIVIAGRNSLLNTYLFYQVLAYMGLRAGDWLIELDRGDAKAIELASGVGRLLGAVEVSVQDRDGRWVPIGSFHEVGPIAREVQVVPIPPDVAAQLPSERWRVRLTLARGNWKIDFAGLAALEPPVSPAAIPLADVTRGGHTEPEALRLLLDPDAYLVTYPGDAYTLHFELPEGDSELFLESRGYYYEWMRREWLAEEDQGLAALALADPEATLRRLAPEYKKIEGRMEEYFWKSRVDRRGLAVGGGAP